MKNKPNGFDLLALLINLYADQEGVNIAYELVDEGLDSNEQAEGKHVEAS